VGGLKREALIAADRQETFTGTISARIRRREWGLACRRSVAQVPGSGECSPAGSVLLP
jgi:hypothetical protein